MSYSINSNMYSINSDVYSKKSNGNSINTTVYSINSNRFISDEVGGDSKRGDQDNRTTGANHGGHNEHGPEVTERKQLVHRGHPQEIDPHGISDTDQ